MDKIKGKIKYNYDSHSDVLYSFINKPRPAVGRDLSNGVTLRIDHKIKKIVGFTIVDCKYKIKHGIIKNIPHFEDIDVSNLVKEITHK